MTYFFQPSGSVSCLIAEIALIGEYIVQSSLEDLFSEDHFVVFVRRGSREWLEIPVDAAGCEEVLQQLSNPESTAMRTSLIGGTGFTSRIMWPPAQSGKPLFVFEPVRGVGLTGRLKLLLSPKVSHGFSPDALFTLKSGHESTLCNLNLKP